MPSKSRKLALIMRRVYVFSRAADGWVKVGISRNPERRVRTLECACGYALKVEYVSELMNNASQVEAEIHALLDGRKLGEWFDCGIDPAVSVAKDITARSGRFESENRAGGALVVDSSAVVMSSIGHATDSTVVASVLGIKHAYVMDVIKNMLKDYPDLTGVLSKDANTAERWLEVDRLYRGQSFNAILMNRQFFILLASRFRPRKQRGWSTLITDVFDSKQTLRP